MYINKCWKEQIQFLNCRNTSPNLTTNAGFMRIKIKENTYLNKNRTAIQNNYIFTLFTLSPLCVAIGAAHLSFSNFQTIQTLQPRRRAVHCTLDNFFFFSFPDLSLANDKILTILSEHSMSLWKLEFQVQPHYSVFLARRLHTSGWSISRVINKITLARFWQASVIAANELSTSKINQSRENDLVYAQLRK